MKCIRPTTVYPLEARDHQQAVLHKPGENSYLFTSESVSEGHPDKVCDRISDAVVDTFLASDPQSRVAVETLATTNRIVLAGEVRGPAEVTADLLEEVARSAVRGIGYEQDGFHWQKMIVMFCNANDKWRDIRNLAKIFYTKRIFNLTPRDGIFYSKQ